MHPVLGSVTEHIRAVLCEGLVACDRLFVEVQGLCVLTVPAISTDYYRPQRRIAWNSGPGEDARGWITHTVCHSFVFTGPVSQFNVILSDNGSNYLFTV